MITKLDRDDVIGITAFACIGLLLLLLAVAVVLAVLNITPAAWIVTVVLALSIVLPVVSAACVIVSEVV